MGQISDSKAELVKALIQRAPDAAIRNLLAALSADVGHDEGLSRVQDMLEAEAGDRRVRNLALAPVAPLCASPGPFSGLWYPPRALAALWAALKADAADEVATARALAADWRMEERSHEPFDLLCAIAAAGVRERRETFAAAASAADHGSGSTTLAACLEIAPVVRRSLDQLPQWLGRMTSEKVATLRLAFRDAVAIADDAGPRFFEMLAAHLSDPWLILRVISGVMDRPNESYVAGSELGGFGERVLADIERRTEQVTAFKGGLGPDAARAAALAVHTATAEITEMEESIHLAPDGVWGKRLARLKKTLAAAVEGHFKAAEAALAQALPLQTVRMGPRAAKGIPRLTHDPDLDAAQRAAALLTFMGEVRTSAAAGGFAAARAKMQETLELRLDTYVEDMLEEFRAPDAIDLDRARAYMEIAAEFCGLTRDERAAQIVRRRLAAAA